MKHSSIVSIIVPCYNQAQYLQDALNSVLIQTYQEWECIIVNDGSPDNTEEVSREWCLRDKRFKYLKKENGGLSSARNEGIKISTGKYILPLDADDMIGSEYLEEAIKILEMQNDIGIVYCNAELFGEKNGKWKLPDYSENTIFYMNTIFCSAVFRKSDFLKTGGYNTNMIYGLEDWDFWLSLIEMGIGVFKLPHTYFFYRTKKDVSMTNELQLNDEKRLHSFNTIYHNHYEFFKSKIGNPIELYAQLNAIKSSKDFKIGNFILRPFRYIKRIYKILLNK